MNNFIPVDQNNTPLPGDYLKYKDEHGELKGCGILVKTVIDKRRPLTESYYLLLNRRNGKMWKIRCHRYTFIFMRHKTHGGSSNSDSLGDYLRSLILPSTEESNGSIDDASNADGSSVIS
jgi:hypothetical protein